MFHKKYYGKESVTNYILRYTMRDIDKLMVDDVDTFHSYLTLPYLQYIKINSK